jgi:hypothetical protein
MLYADANFGWSFNLSGTETKTLGQTIQRFCGRLYLFSSSWSKV